MRRFQQVFETFDFSPCGLVKISIFPKFKEKVKNLWSYLIFVSTSETRPFQNFLDTFDFSLCGLRKFRFF